MMIFDNKKAVGSIISKRHSDGSSTSAPKAPAVTEAPTREENGELDGRHAAMQDFMTAHAEGSAQRMSEAMANFMDLHNARGDADKSDEE